MHQTRPALKQMLVGQYVSKLTDKDRIAIPKKFREEFGQRLILARWYESCLVLVSKDSWEKLLIRLIGKTKLVTSPVRDIDRFILGSAFEIGLDKQGRFVIPEILMNYANIRTEVVFVGLGDRIEVWSSTKWDELEKGSLEKASQAIEKIAREKRERVIKK